MQCPFCKHDTTRVIDSRSSEDRLSVRRRRECPSCSARFTTYERYEELPIMVVKRDGRKESFSREKLLKGLVRASEKRNIDMEQLNELASGIKQELTASGMTEISSEAIGEMAMKRLKGLDDVAYVRFASVYRDFNNVEQFKTIIDELAREDNKNGKGNDLSDSGGI